MEYRTRFAGVLFRFILLASLFQSVSAASGTIAIGVHPAQVGRYSRLELELAVDRRYEDPFDPCEVAIDLLIESPSGKSLVAPAFFAQDYERHDVSRDGKTVAWYYPKGEGVWKARFAPMETGTYAIRAQLKDDRGQALSETIRVECVPSESKGFLRTSNEDPRFFEFSEGDPFFAIGQNIAFIGEGQYVNVPKAEEIFGKLAENGANFVRIWTCCDDWAIAIEAPKSAWKRSWNRQSPIVPTPEGEGQCVEITGDSGMSIEVSPSHRVVLRSGTRYTIRGRCRTEGAAGLRLQVGEHEWRIGNNGAEWQTFAEEFRTDDGTGANDYSPLRRTVLTLEGDGTAWVADLSLKESDGGAELLWEAEVNRPVRGYYNPLDCFMLDAIVEAAERNGIYLMLCVLTRDLYMNPLSDTESVDYERAIRDAKDFMRYAVARWGYSTSVGSWEYFNEMDPGKPTDRFYEEVGGYLDEIDVYHHLQTTSTWHPSARDCRLEALEIGQAHHYLRPNESDFQDEVGAIVEKARFLREHAPSKPALIGEFGLATDKWGLSEWMKKDTEGVHFHNALWASALAGPSGTAMFWWWEQLDMQDAYRHYRPLSAYLSDVSFAGLEPTTADTSDDRLRVLGYQGSDCAYLWLSNREAAWWNLVVAERQPAQVEKAVLTVENLTRGDYVVQWWDTRRGECFETQQVRCEQDRLRAAVPTVRSDVACKISKR